MATDLRAGGNGERDRQKARKGVHAVLIADEAMATGADSVVQRLG